MIGDSLESACVGCGASLEYFATDRALKCLSCDNVIDMADGEEAMQGGARAIVPMAIDVEALTDAVYHYLAGGDTTPDHLLEQARITKQERFYVPAYFYRGHFEATWTASFGYDRTEHYTEYEKRYEGGLGLCFHVNKTRVVTDWHRAGGKDGGTFAVFIYAGARLLGSSLNLRVLVEEGSPDVVPYEASLVSGFSVEEFQHGQSHLYGSQAHGVVNNVIDSSVRRHARGDKQNDWHWKADVRRESVPALVPVCHAIYEFEGKQYNVWLSGFDKSFIVADDLPFDKKRQRSVNISFIPLGAAIIGAAYAIFGMNSSWSIPMEAIAASLVYGLLRRKAIADHSRKVRRMLLAHRQLASRVDKNTCAPNALSRPWLAHTRHDHVILPFIAMAFALIPVASALI